MARLRAAAVVGVLAAALATIAPAPPVATIALYQDGVSLDAAGSVQMVPAGEMADYLPGSRVLRIDAASDPAAAAVAGEQRAWLTGSRQCGAGTSYASLVSDALLDLNVLLEPTLPEGEVAAGALVAGWSPRWRYVWPRDGAFAARALASVGHTGDALSILTFLASVQSDDGSFAARYLPSGDGVPDARADQLDGVGWALWATDGVLAAIADTSPGDVTLAQDAVRSMATLAVEHLLAATDGDDHLPPVSSDYWERTETKLTLGTATVVLGGLESASRMPGVVGDDLAAAALERAEQVRAAVERRFAPDYRRVAGGVFSGDGRDAATAFALEPFVAPLAGAESAWRASIGELARPAGGIAPGATWRNDGISWTPETSLYALTAATLGDAELAVEWLTWLDEHRTASGALPEKVLADGSPAAVAPLAWTAANVVLTACALDDAR